MTLPPVLRSRPPRRSSSTQATSGHSSCRCQSWRRRAFRRAIEAAGLEHGRPYDLRHSFASLLLHEGRSVIYVARQLGHDARLTLSTYGRVIDEFEDMPRLDGQTAIAEARAAVPTAPLPPADATPEPVRSFRPPDAQIARTPRVHQGCISLTPAVLSRPQMINKDVAVSRAFLDTPGHEWTVRSALQAGGRRFDPGWLHWREPSEGPRAINTDNDVSVLAHAAC